MPRINPLRSRFAGLTPTVGDAGAAGTGLVALDVAIDNPGNLTMLAYVPDALPPGAPLVVVLHGCTQTAAAYDDGAGWSTLADTHGFALLYPEQSRANNANLCFNWFDAGDTVRDGGEAASIAAGVAAIVARHRLDPARVFVTGLSAGGAMASVMLAAYPDVFAGGAIIAGLPYGSASGVSEALSAMSSPPVAAGPLLGDRVRAASDHDGPWPRVSVWHGDLDRTVSTRNGAASAAQWCDVHGVDTAHASSDGRLVRTVWRNAAGVAVVELNRIDGMAHGTPLAAGSDGATAGPYMLDVGVASPTRIAAFFGLIDAAAVRPAARPARATPIPPRPAAARARPVANPLDIGRVIGDALRSAGLMK